MTKKTVGYVQLEWTCRKCGAKNLGTQKACSSCGSLMEEGQQFELPAEQKLQAGEGAAKAAAGPDVHCPYCGARNPAGTKVCTQCGGDLTKGTAREAGQVLGAYQSGPGQPRKCPFCGTDNPAAALTCQKCGGSLAEQKPAPLPPPAAQPAAAPAIARNPLLIIGGVLLCVVCAVAAVALLSTGARTTEASGVVDSVSWQRTIQIVELRPVTDQAWADQIPAGAQRGACTQKLRSTQDDPAPGAEEVCGTPYIVDQGDGTGKVVQDCKYNVYDSWCEYTRDDWQVVNTAVAQGTDLQPQWPVIQAAANRREGDRGEEYTVFFRSENTRYQYKVSNAADFAQFQPGSRWAFKVNAFGGISDLRPAQ